MLTTLLASVVLATPVSVRVDGEGFLRFARGEEVVYAKQATLVVKDGKLCSDAGPCVLPTVPVGPTEEIEIGLQGRVVAIARGKREEVGRLVLARFSEDIRPVESDGFLRAFGDAKLGEPGEGIFGVIRPGTAGDGTGSKTDVIREPVKSDSDPVKGEGSAVIKVYAPEGSQAEADAKFAPSVEFLRAGGVRVVLRDTVTVDGEKVYLGSIATVFANAELSPMVSAADLGASPMYGVPRIIDDTRVKASLVRMGIKAEKIEVMGSSRSKVSRAGQTIEEAAFVAAAVEGAQERFGAGEFEAGEPVVALEAPAGEVTLVTENVFQSGNTVTVRVVAFVDGKRVNARSVKLYNRAVPVQLRSGDKVTVIVKSNDVVVETSGKVRSVDGATGVVTVELDSKAILTGKVNKLGQIEVTA